jgi:hypothetical protein
MTTSRQEPGDMRAGVSVSEMARMVGLSRQRFHQLVQAGVFPQPQRDEASGRPYYDEPTQQQCVEVRRRNCGVNGQVVLFYTRRFPATPSKPKEAKPKLEPKGKDVPALVDGLNALGLTTATAAQVQRITEELYPEGTAGIDQGEVLRAVFLHLKRKNTAENVGRKYNVIDSCILLLSLKSFPSSLSGWFPS